MKKHGSDYTNDSGTVRARIDGFIGTPRPWGCVIEADKGYFRDGMLSNATGTFTRRFATPEAAIAAGEKELLKRPATLTPPKPDTVYKTRFGSTAQVNGCGTAGEWFGEVRGRWMDPISMEWDAQGRSRSRPEFDLVTEVGPTEDWPVPRRITNVWIFW